MPQADQVQGCLVHATAHTPYPYLFYQYSIPTPTTEYYGNHYCQRYRSTTSPTALVYQRPSKAPGTSTHLWPKRREIPDRPGAVAPSPSGTPYGVHGTAKASLGADPRTCSYLGWQMLGPAQASNFVRNTESGLLLLYVAEIWHT